MEISKTILHHFPDLYQQLSQLSDPRKGKQYQIEEVVFGAISMFIFKCGSRNAFGNLLVHNKFRRNYEKLFSMRLPDPDTVADVMKNFNESELEEIKVKMVHTLLENKTFNKQRFGGKIIVAIDGSGIASFKKRHCNKCLHKTYKKGTIKEKTVYFHHVLEAKLVTKNGFSISLATEWIENKGEYDKQDCERKAFVRLAEKIKKHFPRTNICICADGLYPYEGFFKICKDNKWAYIAVLKDKSLKNFWKKIRLKNRECVKNNFVEHAKSVEQRIQWINKESFGDYKHNWIQINEQTTNSKGGITEFKFVYLTNIEVSHENIIDVCTHARLRWKIEKQGFDQQKNHGYNICHKYCRKSELGMKNYYQCCQIGHILNQLVELTKNFKDDYTPGKITIKHTWFCLKAFMIMGDINSARIEHKLNKKTQIQYRE